MKKAQAILYSEKNTHWCTGRKEVSKQAISSEKLAMVFFWCFFSLLV